MIKNLAIFLCCVITFGCSAQIDCNNRAIVLSDKYESELFVDKDKERNGFFKLAESMQTDLGNTEEAFSLLNNGTLSAFEKDNIIDEHGPILLMMAISIGDTEKVKYYLNNGVDSLHYYKHVGVLALDLLEFRSEEMLSVFQSFFDKKQIRSDLFEEIELFYAECVLE
jgi:hypothetical protein